MLEGEGDSFRSDVTHTYLLIDPSLEGCTLFFDGLLLYCLNELFIFAWIRETQMQLTSY